MKRLHTSRHLATLAAIAILVLLAGCGGGSSTANPNSTTGNWSVTLFNSNNVPVYAFTTKLNQQIATPSSTSPITGSNLNLTTTDPSKTCFNANSSAEQTGVYTVNDTFNGLSVNSVQLTVVGAPGTISMRGPFTTSSISGPWTLVTTGTGCDVSGTFLMNRI